MNVIAGMAYFPGTGPNGKVCAECESFLGTKKTTGIGKGDLQAGRCDKYITMSRSANGGRAASFKLQPNTPACKYFCTKFCKT